MADTEDSKPQQRTDKLIDGRKVARAILDRVTHRAAEIERQARTQPTLATVLVGHDPASAVYVRMQQRTCARVGIRPVRVDIPADATTRHVVEQVGHLATDTSVHGIVVQHPVPGTIDRRAVFEAIPIEKDVDGVTSAALGRLILGMPAFGACTPKGIMYLLDAYSVEIEGLHAVVIGRSPILGRPMASMLINRHATVTLCHSRTRGLPGIVRQADLLIAAVGRPKFVQGEWLKPGSVVIDAGYNDGNVGDVDFEQALPRVRLITPVPGGVGPMTIATLMEQSVAAAAQQLLGPDE